MVLDIKDRKLLYELETNCRQSLGKIAKKVGMSKTAVIYRIDRLLEKKIIDNFATITNGNKLGYDIYTVFLKLQGPTNVKEDILKFVKAQPGVGWCVHVFGNLDIIFAALQKDILHLQKLLDLIEDKFSDNIKERDLLFNTQAYSFGHKYLYYDLPTESVHDQYGADHSQMTMSENDCAVMNCVKQKPRASIVEIAQEVDLSPDTVKRSLSRLTKDGIILRFKAHFNVFELGYQWNIILLSLRNMSKEKKSQLIEYIRRHPNFVYAVDCVGRWNFVINVHSKTSEHFKDIYWQFRNAFDTVIKHDEVLSVATKQKHFFNPVKLR